MGVIDHQFLRPLKAARRQTMADSPFPQREDLRVQIEDGATILPVRDLHEPGPIFGRGGVVSAQGEYVPLSGLPRRVDLGYEFEAGEFRDQKVVYCGFMVNQWGHFLVEGVTRLWYALKEDPTIDKYIFTLNEHENREIRGNYREFLALLGIWEKTEFINRPITYRQVVIPEIAFQCQSFRSREFVAIYDRVAENAAVDPGWKPLEKIYFSRSQFKKYGEDAEFGHDLLDDFFARNGYACLAPEKLTLSQMIFYIRQAKTVATLSGSVAHNLLFARDGQQAEIMERLVFNVDYQVDIDRLRALNAVYVDVSFPLYTTDFAGPFLLGWTECLEAFAKRRGYLPPSPEYLTEKYRRQCFGSYMALYWHRYHYCWYMAPWYTTCADFLLEGYLASYQYFQDYLEGRRPFLTKHYFDLYYIKRNAKFLLRKLGLRKDG